VRDQRGGSSGYEVLGMAYTGLKDYQKALHVNRPAYEPAKVRLGQTYGAQGDAQAALGVF
jgi:hypothetical protein